jgi:hypothetical protein
MRNEINKNIIYELIDNNGKIFILFTYIKILNLCIVKKNVWKKLKTYI